MRVAKRTHAIVEALKLAIHEGREQILKIALRQVSHWPLHPVHLMADP